MPQFEPSRDDGRSDRQVVYDLTGDAEPDTTFTYDDLTTALQAGLAIDVDRARVYRAVAQANKDLLAHRKRYLTVVRAVGYRMIRADEHLSVALDRKSSAVSKLDQGIKLLRNARIDELSEAQRLLHQGQLTIMAGLYDAVRDSARRHDRQEKVIEDIKAQQRSDIEDLSRRLGALEEERVN